MNVDTLGRRRRTQVSHFIALVLILLVLLFGSFFLLRPVVRYDTSPVATTQRFVGFIELKQFSAARKLMTPDFQSTPGWHGILYSLATSIDPSEAGYHLLSEKSGLAQVQFSNEQGGYLYLKQVNGQWLIASPKEISASQSSGGPPTGNSPGGSPSPGQ